MRLVTEKRIASLARLFAGAALVLAMALTMWAASAQTESPDDAKRKKDAPASPAPVSPTATPESSEPQTTTATYADWTERCQRVQAGGEVLRVCEIAQGFHVEGQSAPFAQLAIGRIKKGGPLQVTLALPVDVSFPSAPKIIIERAGVDPIELAWRRCVPGGCFADATLSDHVLAAWRTAQAQTRVESRNAAGHDFHFAVSSRGFSQALDALLREQ